MGGDHQIADLFIAGEEAARLHQHFPVVPGDVQVIPNAIAGLQALAQLVEVDLVTGQGFRVEPDADDAGGGANGVDIPGAVDPFQLRFDGVGHLAQLIGPGGGVVGTQRQGDDRHVIDTLRFDNRLPHAQVLR